MTMMVPRIAGRNVVRRLVPVLVALMAACLVVSGVLSTRAAHGGGTHTVRRSGPVTIAPGDWPMFEGDIGRSGYNAAETTITATNAHSLKIHWEISEGSSISTQPVVVNGLVYWGSWDGIEHASDLNGNPVWTANLGQNTDTSCVPPTVGVASTAAVANVTINGTDTGVVFVGGGNDNFYALDAQTGAVLWQTPLGTLPAYFLWSSPVVYNGSVYEGVASFGDCPLVRGEMVQMDATTGAIQHIFYTMPSGCKGAGVWGSPTVDAAAGTLYFGTSNAGACSKTGQYFWTFIELNTADLSLVHSWELPPAQQTKNADFGGAAPTLFTATINGTLHNLVGAPNQNGLYYAFDRTDISQGPVWSYQLATPGRGSISSSAWDGTHLYTAGTDTTINGVLCQASARELDPATGVPIWQTCWTAGRALSAVIAVPGLVAVTQGRYINVLDSTTGKQLFRYLDSTKGATFYGAPVISNGVLYAGNQVGHFFAFGL